MIKYQIKSNIIIVFLALFFLSILSYSRFLNNYFTSEDFTYLYHSVIAPGYQSFFLPSESKEWIDGRYSPLIMSFYRLGYQLFNLQPLGYRLIILITHALNSFLVYLIGVKIMRHKRWAFFLAAAYVTYPLHIISLLWLSCANFVLATFWFLLGFYFFICYLEKLKGFYYFFFLIFWAIACLFQEISYTLPLVILAYLLTFPPSSKALRRIDNIIFLTIPILTFYLAFLYFQYNSSIVESLIRSRLNILGQNPAFLLLKPLLGMAVMSAPDASYASWMTNIVSYTAHLVDNYPLASQIIFLGIIVLCFKNRPARLGMFFYLVTSFMLHFASFGALNNYYLPAVGYFILIVALLLELEKLSLKWRKIFSWGSSLFLILLVSLNILHIQRSGSNWQEGGEIAKGVLVKVKKKYPVLSSGSLIFLFNVPAVEAENRVNIFRFRTINDAFKLIYKDPSLTVYNTMTNKIYFDPKTILLNGGYLYLPYNQLLDLTGNYRILQLFNYLKRPAFIFESRFPASNKIYFRYHKSGLEELKIKRPIDFSRLFEVQLLPEDLL